jgi:transcriptional regulator with XRE-family HTH domain
MSESRAGVLLRQAREVRHYSQREVAELTGTTQSAISRIESGASVPSFDRVLEVLGTMGLGIDLRIEMVEVDEAALERNLALDPAARFKNAVRTAQFVLGARRAMAVRVL